MVMRMPASEFIQYLKAAKMLFAEKRLGDIETASFAHFKKDEDRQRVMRHLERASREFIRESLTNFADFAADVARKLVPGGRQ